jgi:hypothetical protein
MMGALVLTQADLGLGDSHPLPQTSTTPTHKYAPTKGGLGVFRLDLAAVIIGKEHERGHGTLGSVGVLLRRGAIVK